MLYRSCIRFTLIYGIKFNRNYRIMIPNRRFQQNLLRSSSLLNIMRFQTDFTPDILDMDKVKRGRKNSKKDDDLILSKKDEEENFNNIDINIELEPVDMKMLNLPLHTMETIPSNIIANLKAKDKTIIFSPFRKQEEVNKRLDRMKHRFSIQPLGKVLHFCFFAIDSNNNNNNNNNNNEVKKPIDVTPETFNKIKEVMRTYTRFIVTDERWPLELSMEVTPFINREPEKIKSEFDVVDILSRVMSEELKVGAWCGISSTPILSKMACDEARNECTLSSKDLISGGIVFKKHYKLPNHDAIKKFVENMPISKIPIVTEPQVQLLKEVYGIVNCGEIAIQQERLGYSLSSSTMEYFLAISFGTMRLRGEVATTLLKKATRCKSAQIRRESQYGRVVSEENFLDTVMGIFDTVYKDLIMHDFVTGRVTLDTRRFVPRVFWVTEEYEDIQPRTNDREILRDIVLRAAKRFAPRRTKEFLDMYIVSIHFADIRTWSEEYETNNSNEKKEVKKSRGGSRRRTPSPMTPEEKKKHMKSNSPQARKKLDTNKPRGIIIVS